MRTLLCAMLLALCWTSHAGDNMVSGPHRNGPRSATYNRERITAAHGRPGVKLIKAGYMTAGAGNTETPEYLSTNRAAIEALPFDGTSINIYSPTDVHLSNGHTWWSTTAIVADDYTTPLATLAAIPWTTFTDNFLYIGTGHGGDTFSWDDDESWATVLANVAILAKIAHDGGCVGVIFNREYGGETINPWNFKGGMVGAGWTAGYDFTTYSAVVKARGAQFMAALQSEFPNIKVLSYFAYGGMPVDLENDNYGLNVPFLDGMVSVADPGSVIIDGREGAYYDRTRKEFESDAADVAIDGAAVSSDWAAAASHIEVGLPVYVDPVLSVLDAANPFDLVTFENNSYTPDQMKQAIVYAMESSDSYVWIHQEGVDWCDVLAPYPAEYVAALLAARTAVMPAALTYKNVVGFEMQGTVAAPMECSAMSAEMSVQGTVKRSGTSALLGEYTTTADGYALIRGVDSNGVGTTFQEPTMYHRTYYRYETKPTTASTSEEILQCRTTNNLLKMAVRIDDDGLLSCWDQTGTAQMGTTGTTVLAVDTFYCIEVSCGTETAEGDNDGAYAVRVDGVAEPNLSGTGNVGTLENGYIALGKVVNRSGESCKFFYDDYACTSDGWPNTGHVLMMLPDDDSVTHTGWTAYPVEDPVTHKHLEVDAVPIVTDDSVYITSTTADAAYTAQLQSCATVGISGTIHAVKYCAVLKRGAETNNIRVRARSGAAHVYTSGSSTTSYAFNSLVSAVDVANGALWTTAALDAIEVGVVNATATAGYCSFLGVMVDFEE